MAETKRQYMELLENSAATIGNLKKELEEARSQLVAMTADRDKLQAQLAEARGPQHHLYTKIKELEERNRLLNIKSREERQKLEEELKNLRYSFESQGRRLAEKQTRLDELEETIELHQQSAPAIDLPEQVGEIVNFLKQSLPPDTKWPKRIIPALRKFLETKESNE